MSALREAIARRVYSVLMRAATPLYLLKVRGRGVAEPLYAHELGERIGRYRATSKAATGSIWLHAVSLGETRAAAPLVAALRAALPGRPVLLTHGTATGRAAGQPLLSAADTQAWLPWDEPGAVERFFDHFEPVVCVLMETEIWPNLLAEARRRRTPAVLANARMSERSRSRFGLAAALLAPAYRSLAIVFAQTEADAARLREVGARDVRVVGNLKFDVAVDRALLDRGRRWRRGAGARRVVLAASTREGEEESLLAAWRELPQPRPLLAIVPRHPQRFDDVAVIVDAAGFTCVRRSRFGEPGGDPLAAAAVADGGARFRDSVLPPDASSADIWLGDSLLEMPAWYAFADVAMLGGSFAPLGGQNLIEAAACGCPVVMGPHTFNFEDAANGALDAGAAVRVGDWRGAIAEATEIADGRRRGAMSQAGLDFAARHRGVATRVAAQIAALVRDVGVSPSSAG